jgi:hypothetical protein
MRGVDRRSGPRALRARLDARDEQQFLRARDATHAAITVSGRDKGRLGPTT